MGFRNRTPKDQPRPTVDCGETMTKQSMKKDTDINFIMSKYRKTGMINFVNTQQAEYMDTEGLDFHDAMNAVIAGKEMFSQMPSDLRKKFKNDPGTFLEFVHNPENNEEMYELGLKQRPEGWEPPAKPAAPAAPETPPTAE